MEYKVRESRRVFDGKAFNVRIDLLYGPTGATSRVDIVEHPGAIALIPIDEQERVWLVRQYRHPAGEELLELPAGTLDPQETPAACASRECREEIGMAPGELIHLGGTFIAPGYSSEYLHFFLAHCDWFIVEYDGKDLFWGFAILNADYANAEWGYISFEELKNLKSSCGIEVDSETPWFPKKAREIQKIREAGGVD